MRFPLIIATAMMSALAACGGSALPERPTGLNITTPGIDAYVTDHNGFTRARTTRATEAADAAILAAFDTGRKPVGYANVFTTDVPDSIQIEVIAQVQDGRPTRILRVTADQGPFDNLDARNGLIAGPDSTDVYYYRGDATVYARIDDGPLMVGTREKDTTLQVDFVRQSVDLQLRTGVSKETGSQIRAEIDAADMPFNIVDGTFGGPVTLRLWSPDTDDIFTANGYLRANIAATNEELRDYLETSTASGVFNASGTRITADGLFWATHPNAR